ncbi:DUF1062 domain-containing protein [Pseudobacteriovorax antillogorgiicola]|uniref:DUF1062 domain-containing protein n=1 Tax=Pseudobacteriovorax antillogorgiicola TaxID=1513793 RepID=A0A1Y6CYA2_9BACT|nr:DUF1062 domain-containing protein [Pseudobacteriovorax antillogorgiicola]TCS42213.1 hypothetical protein EDD56_14310 [Pseudobacteriovorax antillogorgiicola]SMF82805.1 hypothetical protein SAMN06296036_14317 [Pseudobacteriovorax antillogorgiicola]
MTTYKHVTWTIASQSTPSILRYCRKCQSKREFNSSRKFRVNGNHKLLDVWLIYKCCQCDQTWNREILARTHVTKIDSTTLRCFRDNDHQLAERYANDIHGIKGVTRGDIVASSPFIKGLDIDLDSSCPAIITVNLEGQCNKRIDSLLAEVLDISRSKLMDLIKRQFIRSSRDSKAWYRRPPQHGQTILLGNNLSVGG